MRQLLLRLDPEGVERKSHKNFAVGFIKHWDQITFGTLMDLIKLNPMGSVFMSASADIQERLFG